MTGVQTCALPILLDAVYKGSPYSQRPKTADMDLGESVWGAVCVCVPGGAPGSCVYPGSTSSPAPSTVKPPPVASASSLAPGPLAPSPLATGPQASLLSKVEMNPGELLGALSKTHAQGGVMQGEGGGGVGIGCGEPATREHRRQRLPKQRQTERTF